MVCLNPGSGVAVCPIGGSRRCNCNDTVDEASLDSSDSNRFSLIDALPHAAMSSLGIEPRGAPAGHDNTDSPSCPAWSDTSGFNRLSSGSGLHVCRCHSRNSSLLIAPTLPTTVASSSCDVVPIMSIAVAIVVDVVVVVFVGDCMLACSIALRAFLVDCLRDLLRTVTTDDDVTIGTVSELRAIVSIGSSEMSINFIALSISCL